ncbi:MAG TPA: zinc-dependent alcohol dehydrogenase family protein [Thermoanaerobaculia bacterium]|nr:zinc-dependent alcohol dehydrogenase family protein [Thermoanaerobaculia bacterium]
MLAMILEERKSPLRAVDIPRREPGPGQIEIEVRACAVCRTDLHIVDGELAGAPLPITPGHQIVGRVSALGTGAHEHRIGYRVGVPWLGWTCGVCRYCTSGRENLCAQARFTGYEIPGGYAEYTVADERFCLPLPDSYSDIDAAPLLCGGLIGFRAWQMAGEAQTIGFYGFGSAAHILLQIARADGRSVFAFTRAGDRASQELAMSLGASWAGASDETPPEPLEAAIIFAPVGALVPQALGSLAPGGSVICAGIHMSDIPRFPYSLLWKERSVRSVANLTRQDGHLFFERLRTISIRPHVTTFPLREANNALRKLRDGEIEGSAVLTT